MTAKPAPVELAALMVSAALPVLLRVMFCAALLPTPTLPKFTLEGLIVN